MAFPNDQVPRCEKSIRIIYEDEDILVVLKPEFLFTLPSWKLRDGDSLLFRLRETHPTAAPVHRLDLDTSGLVIVALSRPAARGLAEDFRLRRVTKHYQALVDGIVSLDAGKISLPIAKNLLEKPLNKICLTTGKPALTHWSVEQRYPDDNKTLLLLKPITGRSHQLRLHMFAFGHPILGCDLYAPLQVKQRAPRLMLHANYLRFIHPIKGGDVEVSSPDEFALMS